MTDTVQTEAVNGTEIFVPLNKLKKHPKNARKVPHGEAAIEALAASIQHKGLIQNLVVQPELGANGEPTGCYLVTAGEGRRLAQLLRAKRKQIRKSEPVRCRLDIENDPAEISLDENVTRTAMHPADQFERFHELARDKGWGAEEIGARFGVSAQVVKQRLRLGAVSPALIQVYRENGVTLDQLMAFAITDDHARQEQVFANLSYNKEPWIIRRDLTADNVPATDRRAVFVGADAYAEAGGTIIRDLFTEDRGGFFEDAGLLDTLAVEKLREIAAQLLAEGWKWAEAHIDYPHAHGMRRHYPEAVALSEADEIADTMAAAVLADRHDCWAEQLPSEVGDLWAFVTALDGDTRTKLLAHCVSLSINAVRVPWERKVRQLDAADVLAGAVDLDMTAHWTPTVRSYFGRVTKAHIAEAVAEAVSPEAAERILPMKKPDMADAAEQLVAATGWLPETLRTPRPAADAAEPQTEMEAEEAETPELAVAAE